MTTMTVQNVCNYVYPGQMEAGNISFGFNIHKEAFFTRWTVAGDEQPDISALELLIPIYQRQFDLDYFKNMGKPFLDSFFDEVASQKQYDSALGCVSYASSNINIWRREAQAFIAWRDSVWVYVFDETAKMERGERAIPSLADFLMELPILEWPQ